jgi:hypothetical protein
MSEDVGDSVHTSLKSFETFEIFFLAVLKNISVFWDMLLCRLVHIYQRFGGAVCPHHQGSPRKVDFTEGGCSKFLWNLSTYVFTGFGVISQETGVLTICFDQQNSWE